MEGESLLKNVIGDIERYVLGEDFSLYMELFEEFLELNSIKSDVFKRRLLINRMGRDCYHILTQIVKPQTPKELSYLQIVEKLTEHFNPKKHMVVEHHNFFKRVQQEGETILAFACELQVMADRCNFGQFRDTALRAVFIGGIQNDRLLRSLLEQKEPTFTSSLQLAQTWEANEKSVNVLSSTEQCHKVNNAGTFYHRNSSFQKRGSYNRNKFKYRSDNKSIDNKTNTNNSNFRNKFIEKRDCYICGKIGHLKRDCKFNKKNNRVKNEMIKAIGEDDNELEHGAEFIDL